MGLPPRIRRTEDDDPARAAFIDACLRRLRARKAAATRLARMRAAGVDVREYFAAMGRAGARKRKRR